MGLDQIKYKVVEHFVSINGEGARAGQLALFIRLQSCNLNCSYCDTKWANETDASFTWMDAEELVSLAVQEKVCNVTLTGGEPLLQKNIDNLIAGLVQQGMRVEIETNGTQLIQPIRQQVEMLIRYDDRVCGEEARQQEDRIRREEAHHKEDGISQEIPQGGKTSGELVFTLDYKLGSSGMEAQMKLDNYAFLQKEDTVKFVSGSMADLERAKEIIEKYELTKKCHVYLSPVFGQIEPADMVEFMKTNHMNGVNLQLQLHKFIWDPAERGV